MLGRAWHGTLGGMSSRPNNGTVVRGLRVLRSGEYRRVGWFRTLLSAALFRDGHIEGGEQEWVVMTVMDEAGTRTLASRRFPRRKGAEAARERFVAQVVEMSQADYERADWQQVLDGV